MKILSIFVAFLENMNFKMGTLIQEEISQFTIKKSRFNHACASNAENVWKTNEKDQEQGM